MRRVIFSTLFCFGTLSAMVWVDDPAQVNERMKVRDEIYHYWGTAWATIGMLETLGKSGS